MILEDLWIFFVQEHVKLWSGGICRDEVQDEGVEWCCRFLDAYAPDASDGCNVQDVEESVDVGIGLREHLLDEADDDVPENYVLKRKAENVQTNESFVFDAFL